MKLRHILGLFASLAPATLYAKPLDIGAPAPDLAVTIENGEILNLADLYARGPLLIYFYPKADTPGCTRQACNLRDAFTGLEAAGLAVLGVSADNPEAQKRFREKYELPFHLATDQDKTLIGAFGVTSLGKLAARQSFLVVDGKIAWRDLKAAPARQAEDALAALAALRPQAD